MEADKCISTSSATTAKNQMTINGLDDYSLGMIFNKLPFVDRMRVEGVCQRWYAASNVNWWNYSKSLTIGEDAGDIRICSYDIISGEKNKNMLKKVLQRSGPYLEEIIFSQECGFDRAFERGTIKWIAEFCPKLKRLNTGMLILNGADMFACGSLETLSFTFVEKKGLPVLFRRNKRLRRLNIYSYWSTASDFDELNPGQLECLHIHLSPFFELTAELAAKLADSLVELTFTTGGYTPNLQPISQLKNLRSLDLKVGGIKWLKAEFIAAVAKHSRKIERLFLATSGRYTYEENVFKPLFDLPYLRRLVIIVSEDITSCGREKLIKKAAHLELFLVDTCNICDHGSSLDISCRHRTAWLS